MTEPSHAQCIPSDRSPSATRPTRSEMLRLTGSIGIGSFNLDVSGRYLLEYLSNGDVRVTEMLGGSIGHGVSAGARAALDLGSAEMLSGAMAGIQTSIGGQVGRTWQRPLAELDQLLVGIAVERSPDALPALARAAADGSLGVEVDALAELLAPGLDAFLARYADYQMPEPIRNSVEFSAFTTVSGMLGGFGTSVQAAAQRGVEIGMFREADGAIGLRFSSTGTVGGEITMLPTPSTESFEPPSGALETGRSGEIVLDASGTLQALTITRVYGEGVQQSAETVRFTLDPGNLQTEAARVFEQLTTQPQDGAPTSIDLTGWGPPVEHSLATLTVDGEDYGAALGASAIPGLISGAADVQVERRVVHYSYHSDLTAGSAEELQSIPPLSGHGLAPIDANHIGADRIERRFGSASNKPEEVLMSTPTSTTNTAHQASIRLDEVHRIASDITGVFESGPRGGRPDALQTSDRGGISYGKHQATLTSGTLYEIVATYVEHSSSPVAARLSTYLDRLEAKDTTLVVDKNLHTLLKEAAGDPEMTLAQDQVFDAVYWQPSVRAAETLGIESPLGYALLYDTSIQGGRAQVSQATVKRLGGTVGDRGSDGETIAEQQFLKTYVEERGARLQRIAAKQRAEAADKREAGDVSGAKRLENNAAALEAGASRTRIPSFRDLVESGDLGLTGAGHGHIELSGKPGTQITPLAESPHPPASADGAPDGSPQEDAVPGAAAHEQGGQPSTPERDSSSDEQAIEAAARQAEEAGPDEGQRPPESAAEAGDEADRTHPSETTPEASAGQPDQAAPSSHSGADQASQQWPRSVPLDGLDRAQDLVRDLNPSASPTDSRQQWPESVPLDGLNRMEDFVRDFSGSGPGAAATNEGSTEQPLPGSEFTPANASYPAEDGAAQYHRPGDGDSDLPGMEFGSVAEHEPAVPAGEPQSDQLPGMEFGMSSQADGSVGANYSSPEGYTHVDPPPAPDPSGAGAAGQGNSGQSGDHGAAAAAGAGGP